MNVLQPVSNVEGIATVLTAIIRTMPNTLDFTETLITTIKKLLSKSWPESTRAVPAENQAAPRNTANAIKLDCFAEKSASAFSARTTSRSATKRSFPS